MKSGKKVAKSGGKCMLVEIGLIPVCWLRLGRFLYVG